MDDSAPPEIGFPDAVLARLSAELRGGDDRELWELVVRRVTADLAHLDALEPAPRHLLVTFSRVPGKRAPSHPDEQASLAVSWERDRGAPWTAVGGHPHVKSRRGSYSASVCVPQGTNRLAFVDVLVLWRPRLPWAPPQDTEIGRQTYRFRRDADSHWHFAGVRGEL
jgi:hypothetical protein